MFHGITTLTQDVLSAYAYVERGVNWSVNTSCTLLERFFPGKARAIECFAVGVLRPLRLTNDDRWALAKGDCPRCAYAGAIASALVIATAASVVVYSAAFHLSADLAPPLASLYASMPWGSVHLSIDRLCWGVHYFFHAVGQTLGLAIPLSVYLIYPITPWSSRGAVARAAAQ